MRQHHVQIIAWVLEDEIWLRMAQPLTSWGSHSVIWSLFPYRLHGSNTVDLVSIDRTNVHGMLCLQPGMLKVLISSNFCHFVFPNDFWSSVSIVGISICTQDLWISFLMSFVCLLKILLILLEGLAQHMFISMCARPCAKYVEIKRDLVCPEQ